MAQEQSSTQDLISIVIPVYNTGKYLEGCLQSCLDQTYQNLEVIAVDDCSTDPRTIEILKEFEKKDPRIHVIWQTENRGQGHCRNVGVENSHGKYFSFIDSDDAFRPEFVEKMYQGLEKYHTDFAICDTLNFVDDPSLYNMTNFRVADSATRFNFNGKDQSIVDNKNLAAVGYLLKFPASCYGKMFNTQKYKDSGLAFYDGIYSRHCQDEDWATNSILMLDNFVVLKFTGLDRRMRAGTASMPSINYFECSAHAAFRRFNVIKDHPYRHFYENSIINDVMTRLAVLCYLHTDYDERLKIIDLAHEYIQNTNLKFNGNPYRFSLVASNGWNNLYKELDKHPLPVVYFSLKALHQGFYQESYATKQLLENLASRGLFCASFNTMSNQSRIVLKNMIEIEKELSHFAGDAMNVPYDPTSALFNFVNNGVAFIEGKTDISTKPENFSETDLHILNEGLTKTLKTYAKKNKYESGVVLVSGGDLVTQRTCALVRNLGFKLVYLLNEPAALHFETLEQGQSTPSDLPQSQAADLPQSSTAKYLFAPQDFDAVLSLNTYYAKCFSEKYYVPVETLGYSLNPQITLAEHKNPSFVTFIHPSLEYGLAVFIKIVAALHEINPDLKFLLVQDDDSSINTTLPMLHAQDGTSITKLNLPLTGVSIISENSLDPITVAGMSKVLVSPGLNNDVFASNILDCMINDVPVVASNLEKYAAILGDSGTLLPIPESTLADLTCLPSDEEIAPWVEAIQKWINNPPAEKSYEQKREEYLKGILAWEQKMYEIAKVPYDHNHEEDDRSI